MTSTEISATCTVPEGSANGAMRPLSGLRHAVAERRKEKQSVVGPLQYPLKIRLKVAMGA